MRKTKIIEQVYGKLIHVRNKINFSKRVLAIITSIVIVLNLFTLLYHFNKIVLIFKVSILFIICYTLLLFFYINYLKSRCKKLEHSIYQEQKL